MRILFPLSLPETADPSTPDSGYFRLFANTSGQMRGKNDGGTATTLTGATGAAATNPTTVILGGDVASTGTALIDVTGLKFTLVSGTTYVAEFWIRWQSSATTNGIWLSCNGPATTFLAWNVEVATSTTAATLSYRNTYNSGAATTAASGATTDQLAVMRVHIKPSASGDLIVRMAEEVSAQTSTVKAGSCGLLWTL